jgi:hyperosmotically inducible protein
MSSPVEAPTKAPTTSGAIDMQHRHTPLAALAAATLALSLAACDRAQEDPTMGQQIDGVIAGAERKADEVKSEVAQAAATARAETAQMAEATGAAMKDAAITAAVNAKFAADKSLSPMRIDVDTSQGLVKLEGEAPTGEARNRASALAASVDGVVSVDNRLVVRDKG